MTSELVRIVHCDVCGAEKATEHALTLDGLLVEVDLCTEDSGPLEALQALLEAHGRKVRGGARRTTNPSAGRTLVNPEEPEPAWMLLGRTCAVCQYVTPRRSALNSHARQQHQVAMTDAEKEAGRTFTCQCGTVFTSYMSVTQHQRAHLEVSA